MRKKLLYAAAAGLAIIAAYIKGLLHGLGAKETLKEKRQNIEHSIEETAEDIDDEQIEEAEEELGEHIGRVAESTETEIEEERDGNESEDEDKVECKDDECDETFDTERGMKIHYGQVHTEDKEE